MTQKLFDRAAQVIKECEYLLEHHVTMPLDNFAPNTDSVADTHACMKRMGIRRTTGELMNGRAMITIDCGKARRIAKQLAEAKRIKVEQAYGVAK